MSVNDKTGKRNDKTGMVLNAAPDSQQELHYGMHHFCNKLELSNPDWRLCVMKNGEGRITCGNLVDIVCKNPFIG